MKIINRNYPCEHHQKRAKTKHAGFWGIVANTRMRIAFVIVLTLTFSSCSSGGITVNAFDAYGDEHFQHVTIEVLKDSAGMDISDAEIDFLDENCSGGGSSKLGNGSIYATASSNLGFVNPQVINLTIRNIKTKDGESLNYTINKTVKIKTFKKCLSYQVDGSPPADSEFILKDIHISPYSIAFSGSGTLNKDVKVEVVNDLGEAFTGGTNTCSKQSPTGSMYAMDFPQEIDNTNITSVIIDDTAYNIKPVESFSFTE